MLLEHVRLPFAIFECKFQTFILFDGAKVVKLFFFDVQVDISDQRRHVHGFLWTSVYIFVRNTYYLLTYLLNIDE